MGKPYKFTVQVQPETVEKNRALLMSIGVDIDKVKGTLPKTAGVTLEYEYSAKDGLVTFTVVSKPFVVSDSRVESVVRAKMTDVAARGQG